MAKVMAPTGGKRRAPAPEGVHPTRCIQVVDLGDQESQYGVKRKVSIVFELPEAREQFEFTNEDTGLQESVDRPYRIYGTYTLSTHPQSALRPLLEGWYRGPDGGKFDSVALEAAGGFDLSKILDRPATVQVVHSDCGKYANIQALMPLAADKCPARESDLVSLSLDAREFDQAVFDSLPEYVQGKIACSPQYERLVRSEQATEVEVAVALNPVSADEIPF